MALPFRFGLEGWNKAKISVIREHNVGEGFYAPPAFDPAVETGSTIKVLPYTLLWFRLRGSILDRLLEQFAHLAAGFLREIGLLLAEFRLLLTQLRLLFAELCLLFTKLTLRRAGARLCVRQPCLQIAQSRLQLSDFRHRARARRIGELRF
jgi:hypothetical protein